MSEQTMRDKYIQYCMELRVKEKLPLPFSEWSKRELQNNTEDDVEEVLMKDCEI